MLHFLFHCTFYSYFSFFTIYMLLCCVTFLYIFCIILLHCPLSGPDLIYISLLIIPCIIYYVTNKETLNLDKRQQVHRINSCFCFGAERWCITTVLVLFSDCNSECGCYDTAAVVMSHGRKKKELYVQTATPGVCGGQLPCMLQH